jgi:hypothetical protein
MSLTKRSLAGNNEIIPGLGESLVSDIPSGDVKIANLFLQCMAGGFEPRNFYIQYMAHCTPNSGENYESKATLS